MADVRLLFDANLSPRLPGAVGDIFPGGETVLRLLPPGTSDAAIYDYAAANSYTAVVTTDQDFDLLALRRRGPRVIRFRRCLKPATAETLLRINERRIRAMHASGTPGELVLLIP